MDFSNSVNSSAVPTAPLLVAPTSLERRNLPHIDDPLSMPSFNRQYGMSHDYPDNMDKLATFVSGQITREVESLLAKIGADIYVSAPNFNVKNRRGLPSSNEKHFDSCVFGPEIMGAVVRLVREMGKLGLLNGFPCRIPDFALNNFVFSKLDKILVIAEKAAEMGLKDVDQRIRAFVEACKRCKYTSDYEKIPAEERGNFVCIDSIQAWQTFLKNANIADNWSDKLHFDTIGELFGISPADHAILSELGNVNPGNSSEKLREFGFRWLSKLVNLYACDVCVTDLVNLVMAYYGKESKERYEVAKYINDFADNLTNRDFIRGLVAFSKHVKDSEADDLLANRLINYVNNVKWVRDVACKSVETIVQLPVDAVFDKLAASYVADGCTVFRDPDSQNATALKGTFRL
jgi:hypothetical protein